VNALFDAIVIHIAAEFFGCFEVNNHLEVLNKDIAPWLFFQFKKGVSPRRIVGADGAVWVGALPWKKHPPK